MLVPKGFLAGAGACGIKYEGRPDVAVIFSELEASAAGVFTQNRIQAAPVKVSQEHIRNGRARAIVANSGNANACTGERGLKDARRMAEFTASELGLRPEEVLVASTGVIGVPLPMDRLERGIREACRNLGPDGWEEAEGDHDDRYQAQVRLDGDFRGEDLGYGEGFGYDSPELGHYVGVFGHGCGS